MHDDRCGAIAVIFLSTRSGDDPGGYADAAAAMEALARRQPGFIGVDSARGSDGVGITVSYWTDEAAAVAWRAHPEHAAIRDRGRAAWYTDYRVEVAQVTRSYGWTRP
jgi:heme-degrading monooxygenase HmoA